MSETAAHAVRKKIPTAQALADLLKEIRNERQDVQQLHRESRKRINRGVRVDLSSSRSTKPPALCARDDIGQKVHFQPESKYAARVTVTAQGLQSAHSCVMKWRLCDPSLDAIIGPCPVHSGALGDVAADQVCGAFTICDPLSIEPAEGFNFAFGADGNGKSGDENRVRVEVDVSKQMTVVYEGVANVVKHSTLGAFDEIFCDRGLCWQSVSSRREILVKTETANWQHIYRAAVRLRASKARLIEK